MEETIAKWVIEFLLRQRIDDKIINGVISSLPPVSSDYRLKKTMLLRRIETETSDGCISEKLLEIIEIIEALDHEKGKTASNLMKDAYCFVAVDCTVRFLTENVEENVKYMEMVEIVWRNRVCKSEGLISDTSKRWFSDIEAAVKNSDAFEKIWMRNTRNEALKVVKEYLKEAWECLGPSFLELVAAKSRIGGGDSSVSSGSGDGVVCSRNPCRDLVVVEGTEKGQSSIRRKHVAVKSRRHRGTKISDDDEDAMNKAGDGTTEMVGAKDATLKVDKVKKAIRSNPRKLPLGDHLSDDDVQTAQTLLPTGPRGVVEADQMGSKILESCEVVRVQRALKNNTRELLAAVNDPLPEALQTAQTLASLLVTKNLETATQNQTGSDISTITGAEKLQKAQEVAQKTETDMRNDAGVSKQAGTEMDVQKGSTENDSENVKQDSLNENSRGYATRDHRTQKNLRKRSLMEPNDTCHNYRWDDEIKHPSLGSPSCPRLLSPKALRSCPPLEGPEYMNIQRRRQRKKWAPLEEDTLREGVQKYGRGSWKAILTDAKFGLVFQGRTEVDLKDKWRNLTRLGGVILNPSTRVGPQRAAKLSIRSF